MSEPEFVPSSQGGVRFDFESGMSQMCSKEVMFEMVENTLKLDLPPHKREAAAHALIGVVFWHLHRLRRARQEGV